MVKFITLLLQVTLIPAAIADPVYKSTDPQGNITYAAEPAENAVSVEQVTVPEPPSPEDQQQAMEASRELIERSDKLMQQRMERNLELAKEKARAQQAAEARRAEEIRLEYEQEQRERSIGGWQYYRPYPPVWGWRPPHYYPPVSRPRPKPRPSGRLYWPDQGRY